MQFILILLRLVHIVAGTFWAGSALMLGLIILPQMRKSGAGSERALPMAQLSQAMGIASLLTIVAGSLLYWFVSRFSWAWITSSAGIGFTLGSLTGIVAFLIGYFSTGATADKIAALGAQMQAAGGPPQPEQVAEMARLQAKIASSSKWGTILTTTSLIFMSVARYL
jgi:hypothetical protein